jgi:hypothetical protein
MAFDFDEIKITINNNAFNFFNYWKRYWLIICASTFTSSYGGYLILNSKEVGSGLTAVAISVAIIGWLISERNASENLRRIKRVDYLSSAYEGIALYIRRNPNDLEYNFYLDGLEKSFTIIQLFGERNEIKLVCEIIEKYNASNDGNIECDTLLNMLRDRLRKELLLPKAVKYVRTIRVERPVDHPPTT